MTAHVKAVRRLATGLTGVSLLLLARCASEAPTSLPDPSLVVRGYPNGCIPEVRTEYTDSTEAVLVTFTAPDSSCYPNLVDWGIDMADPVAVDTPQGSTAWRVRSGLPAANMPSPVHVAIPVSGTPPVVLIEFDPPVRSVEFHYSRLRQERAMWGGNIVNADSMQVLALSRTPGTTFYQIYDRKILHSNVASTTPPWDTWTPVKLAAATGDRIQWLWFDGMLVIDDLKITRAPLSCTPVVRRGMEVSCTLSAAHLQVTGWEFTTDSLPAVQDPSTSTVWKGIAARSGTVKVNVNDGATPRSFTARFTVTNRPSPWLSMQTYRQGPELTAPDAEPYLQVPLGRNCPEIGGVATCVNTSRLQPDPSQLPGDGYTAAQIPSGPNRGYWYVDSARWEMKRVGNVNPAILASSSRIHPLPANTPRKCTQALGFGPKNPASANFYQFNDKCQKIKMANFVAAVWGHEGFGYNGGKGHESLAREAAAEPWNDPYAAIDTVVRATSVKLADDINLIVRAIATDITNRAADKNSVNGGPSGNWPAGPIWFWELAALNYIKYPVNSF